MPDKNVNQEKPEQNRGPSGPSQGNRPFPGGIDKEERKGRDTTEGITRDSRDAEMDKHAGASRDSSNRDPSRDFQTGERQPSGATDRSGPDSTQRATQNTDSTGGSAGRMNESRRADNKEPKDVDSEERKSSYGSDRKDPSH